LPGNITVPAPAPPGVKTYVRKSCFAILFLFHFYC